MPRASVLALLALVACTAPDREPVEVQRGRDLRTEQPAAVEPTLEPETVGLLERVLARPPGDGSGAPAEDLDPRPLCLDLGFQAGLGPFRIGGHELPGAAAEAALTDALRARFALEGALSGPLPIAWESLFPPEDETLPAVLDPPLPQGVLARARALGGAYLLAGRLERLEHETVSVYVPGSGTYERRERGRLRLWYQLYELEHGSLICTDLLDRSWSLSGLSPSELASAERLLAEMAASELASELTRCVGDPEDPPE